MTTFRPRDRVHLKGHPHTLHTTGTVRSVDALGVHVLWDDSEVVTAQLPLYLEPAGEPMSQEPLDLTALRELGEVAEYAEIRGDDVLALLDELDKAKRACQTMGRIIDQQCKDALTATDSQDLLWGDDGDGDWGAIWERVLGLGEKAREATARVEAAEREASEWERSFNAERADKYMADDAAKAWRLRAEAAEKAVAKVRELHKPKRITEYNVPVFDEYDSPTVTHNGCTCGSHYYPCPTPRAILDAILDSTP